MMRMEESNGECIVCCFLAWAFLISGVFCGAGKYGDDCKATRGEKTHGELKKIGEKVKIG